MFNPFKFVKHALSVHTATLFVSLVKTWQEKGDSLNDALWKSVDFFRKRAPFKDLTDADLQSLIYYSSLAYNQPQVIGMILQHCDAVRSIEEIKNDEFLLKLIHTEDVCGYLIDLMDVLEKIMKNNPKYDILGAVAFYLFKRDGWELLGEDDEALVFLHTNSNEKVRFSRNTPVSAKEMVRSIVLIEFLFKTKNMEQSEKGLILYTFRKGLSQNFNVFFDQCFKSIKKK